MQANDVQSRLNPYQGRLDYTPVNERLSVRANEKNRVSNLCIITGEVGLYAGDVGEYATQKW